MSSQSPLPDPSVFVSPVSDEMVGSTISASPMPRPVVGAQAKILDSRVDPDSLGYASEGSAGMDLRAVLDEPLTLEPGDCVLVNTGVAIHLENPGLAGMLLPRGGLGVKHGVVLGNLTGLMDADYQGEVLVPLWNRGNHAYVVEPFERIAQYVVVPVFGLSLEFVDEFDAQSVRGEGRLGSSGRV